MDRQILTNEDKYHNKYEKLLLKAEESGGAKKICRDGPGRDNTDLKNKLCEEEIFLSPQGKPTYGVSLLTRSSKCQASSTIVKMFGLDLTRAGI